jgi:Trp operon repressor
MPIQFVDHNAFLAEKPESASFWVHHLIPQHGVVLLWGHTSIGKSPLSWHLALAIATGQPFFFLPVKQGKVLYIELDTPRNLVWERASFLPESTNLRWAFAPALVADTPDWHALRNEAAVFKPDVVFINTLRKAHAGSDIESHVPSEVYGRFQRLIPDAALVFIHHARKAKADDHTPSGEGFSGSQAWQNDAQVAARLYRSKPSEDGDLGTHLGLDVTKSQVCATGELLRLYLQPDGVNLSVEEVSEVMLHLIHSPHLSTRQLSEKLGVSQSSITRAIRKLKSLNIALGVTQVNPLKTESLSSVK